MDHPIELGSISGSNTNNEPKGEEAFNIPVPQFQKDPQLEDEDVAVGSEAGGEDDEDEDDEEENESESDEGEAGG